MGETLAQAAAKQFGFNPLEKRDEHGKWTLGTSADSLLKSSLKALSNKRVTVTRANGGKVHGFIDKARKDHVQMVGGEKIPHADIAKLEHESTGVGPGVADSLKALTGQQVEIVMHNGKIRSGILKKYDDVKMQAHLNHGEPISLVNISKVKHGFDRGMTEKALKTLKGK